MKRRLALTLALLPIPDLLADTFERDQALTLPDILISANRQVEARNDSSAANTIFTRDDIERLQPASVTDLLSRVPGVQVAPLGGAAACRGSTFAAPSQPRAWCWWMASASATPPPATVTCNA